mmetsp:Transcript_2008/g.7374  ORF Transcript_2008/g.7374 Transcript_2008/m.7374 type:complete len:234 (+) Transcript_2008:51-752(+)
MAEGLEELVAVREREAYRFAALTPEECEELVATTSALSEAWDVSREPVDGGPVMQLTVWAWSGWNGLVVRGPRAPRREVCAAAAEALVARLARRLVPRLAHAYAVPESSLTLSWAYVRAYELGSGRVDLKEHSDRCDITVNVLLTEPEAVDGCELYVLAGEESADLLAHKERFFAEVSAPPTAEDLAAAAAPGADVAAFYARFQRRMDPQRAWDEEFRRLYPQEELRRRVVSV